MTHSRNTFSNNYHSIRGFTLIELVVVIIILAIIGVVAAPKFMSLTRDSYQANMQGVAGAIKSATALVHSKCVVDTSCDESAAPAAGNGLGNRIIVQGESITLAYGYPRHTAAGIARAINIEDFADGGDFRLTTYTASGRPGLRIRPNQQYDANDCEIKYSQPLSAGETPFISIDIDNC